MNGSECVVFLVVFLLALVLGAFPILAVAYPSMILGLVIGVSFSFAIGFLAVALMLRSGR